MDTRSDLITDFRLIVLSERDMQALSMKGITLLVRDMCQQAGEKRRGSVLQSWRPRLCGIFLKRTKTGGNV